MKRQERDLNDLSVEVLGIAMMLTGLSNQLDDKESDVLNPWALREALGGVAAHLEQISEDMDSLDEKRFEKKESAA